MTRPGAVRARVGARLVEPHDPIVGSTWRRLQSAGGVATPFLSWEWFAALVAQPATGAGVRVVVVDDGVRPIGLLPFECATDHRGVRVVGQPGGSWLAPDHLDVVAARRDRAPVADAAVGRLRAWRRFDALDLDGLADGSALHAALLRQCRPPRFAALPTEPAVLPLVDLTRAAPEQLLSRNTRKQARRALRAAEADAGGFDVHADPESVTTHLPELMDLHDARFGSSSQIYRGRARRAFHLRAAGALAGAGLVRLYRLAQRGRSTALLYSLVWDDRLLAYGGGIRPDAGTPGHALTALAIMEAAREGFATFDLLRGDSGWKRRFASGEVANHHVRCMAVAPRPVASHARWAVRRAVRRMRDRTVS